MGEYMRMPLHMRRRPAALPEVWPPRDTYEKQDGTLLKNDVLQYCDLPSVFSNSYYLVANQIEKGNT